MFKEFKEFAMSGNVVDLAIGVIIGAAFSKIIDSLVADIVMPIIGGLDFSNHFIGLSKAVTSPVLAEARRQGAVLGWGSFDRCGKLSHHRVHSFLGGSGAQQFDEGASPGRSRALAVRDSPRRDSRCP
jgi:hypothetical protein